MFYKYLGINYSFDELSQINFEDITKGRKGSILVNVNNSIVPIIRTTTQYKNPAQQFLKIHHNLISNIKDKIKDDIKDNENINFNNALIEIYDDNYCSMGYHSDQSLDLEEDSYICLFSCYDNGYATRKLMIKNKLSNEETEILLENNSIILFSYKTNEENLHKIVIDSKKGNKWLGITFRVSKTFIKFINEIPYINDKILRLADENEKKEFYIHRSNENKNIGYKYPKIDYTISISDILFVK